MSLSPHHPVAVVKLDQEAALRGRRWVWVLRCAHPWPCPAIFQRLIWSHGVEMAGGSGLAGVEGAVCH